MNRRVPYIRRAFLGAVRDPQHAPVSFLLTINRKSRVYLAHLLTSRRLQVTHGRFHVRVPQPLLPEDVTIVPEASRPVVGAARDSAATSTPVPDEETIVPVSSSGTAVPTRATASKTYWGSAPALQPGTVLAGRYEILRMLGEGGMGAVYKAQDRELDRVVAIKVIRPELASNPAIIQRFKQGLILARQVTHRNVIRIYDLGEAEGMKFITMEFVEGEDLHSLLAEQGKFSPAEAMQQVLLALDAARAHHLCARRGKVDLFACILNGSQS
jgi:Protein kinase domain